MASPLEAERYSLRKPTRELLRRLSNRINTFNHCKQLAILLGIDEELVTRKKEETKNPNEIALSVLIDWWNTEKASCSDLYGALDRDVFKHLARKFKNDLEPSGASGVQGRELTASAGQSSADRREELQEQGDCQRNGQYVQDQETEQLQQHTVEWGKTMLPMGEGQQRELKCTKDALDKLTVNHELLKKDNDKLKQQIKQLEEEKAVVEEKLSAAVNREKYLVDANTIYEQQLQKLTDQIQTLQERDKDQEEKLQEQRKQLKEQGKKVREQEMKVQELEKKIQEQQEQICQNKKDSEEKHKELVTSVRTLSDRLEKVPEFSRSSGPAPATSILPIEDSADGHLGASQLQPGCYAGQDISDYVSIHDYAEEVEQKVVDLITSQEVWPDAQEHFLGTLPKVGLATVFVAVDKIGDENHSAVRLKKDIVSSTHRSITSEIDVARVQGTNIRLHKDNFEKDVHEKIVELRKNLRRQQLSVGLQACWMLEQWYVQQKG